MAGKSGSDIGQRGQTPGKFPTEDDRQSVAVNVRERKFSDDKRRVCLSVNCKTHLEEANRNRKIQKEQLAEKPETSKTTEKYLQDSYKQAFQRHVDNLNNVISEHKSGSIQDKGKTEVHIHPSKNSINSQKSSPKPLSRLEIKTDSGLNQSVTFGDEEDDKIQSKMNNLKKVNVLTEKFQEENFFEELIEPNPMIVFNHVYTEEEAEKINFVKISLNSRSPSPMLEVPDAKSREKITTRPPL